jgi:hypothetical protein
MNHRSRCMQSPASAPAKRCKCASSWAVSPSLPSSTLSQPTTSSRQRLPAAPRSNFTTAASSTARGQRRPCSVPGRVSWRDVLHQRRGVLRGLLRLAPRRLRRGPWHRVAHLARAQPLGLWHPGHVLLARQPLGALAWAGWTI